MSAETVTQAEAVSVMPDQQASTAEIPTLRLYDVRTEAIMEFRSLTNRLPGAAMMSSAPSRGRYLVAVRATSDAHEQLAVSLVRTTLPTQRHE